MDKKHRHRISQLGVINHESVSGQVKLYKNYLHDMYLLPAFLQERKPTVFIRVPELSVVAPNPSDFDNILYMYYSL